MDIIILDDDLAEILRGCGGMLREMMLHPWTTILIVVVACMFGETLRKLGDD